MGEMAEMMLDGTMCQQCGVYIEEGEAQGFPRTCSDCKPNKKDRNPSTGRYAVKGILNYLRIRKVKDSNIVLNDYNAEVLQIPEDKTRICELIQRDFKKFNRWFNKNSKKYIDESRS